MARPLRRAPLTLSRLTRDDGLRPDMKTRNAALLIAAALLAGVGSAWALLGERPPFGAVELGPWRSYPRMGSSDVDPYGRAILARGPHLPLAAGEGVELSARSDSSGSALDGRCRYSLRGPTLPSRGWTLTMADRSDRALAGDAAAALSDADLVTGEDGIIAVTVSSTVAPGNWLRAPADRGFSLILRFYDTPVSAGVGQLAATALPRIERVSCR
jgi:hypothetical protein